MSEEERAATRPQDGAVKPTPAHGTEDDDAGGDEPVPGLENTGGGGD